ncbi:MAG: Crp/Fnr family transcriptional regulator [Chitinophagales bacterium]|nr:Crp/Fnr family transcriptional regulator [Chitinophagaceae bacterium]MBP9884535.1 Crp/Fnr family transcriptional regulator [Chitinophagales bacterium]
MELDNLKEFTSSPEVRVRLLSYGIEKIYSEGEVILNEDTYVRAIPLVITGNVKVMQTDQNGREILLYYIKSGESCIMSFMAGLHQGKSKVKAVADEQTELLLIPMEKVSLLIKEYPEWLDYLFRLYHKRFEELLEVVNAVAFRKMDERLLSFIKMKCRHMDSDTLSITHEQLANELGTVRVVVSRLLKRMEEEGMVKLGRNKISLM